MLSKFLPWLVLSIRISVWLAQLELAGAYLFGVSLLLSKRQRLCVITTAIIMNIIARLRSDVLLRPFFFFIICFIPSFSLEINYAIIFNIYGI